MNPIVILRARHTVAEQPSGTGSTRGPPATLIHAMQVIPCLLTCQILPGTTVLLMKYAFPLSSSNLFHRGCCVLVLVGTEKLSKALAVCQEELPSTARIQVCCYKTKNKQTKRQKSHISLLNPVPSVGVLTQSPG